MNQIIPPRIKWFGPLALLFDFAAFQLSLLVGYWLWIAFPWHHNYQLFSDFSGILWILPPIGVVVFASIDLYKPDMGVIGVREQSLIFKGIWIIYFLTFTITFFYRGVYFSRLAIFYSIFIAIVLISTERHLLRRFTQWLCQRGIAVHNALIYGAGYHGQRLNRWIEQSPQLGIHVQGYLDDQVAQLVKVPVFPPVLGGFDRLKQLASEKHITMLFIAHRGLPEKKVQEIFYLCRRLGVRCWAIPSLFQFHVERVELQNIGGIPLLGFREVFAGYTYVVAKRILDLFVSIIIMILLTPLFLLIAAILRLTSDEPIFFVQLRVGKDGKKFEMYKFRTLRSNFGQEKISPELLKDGKKIDPFRNFLRVSGLDEIPQLFNVLKGEMSLVGPRPEMPFLVEKYGSLEKERLSVQPGITGLWQISDDRKRLLIHENMDYDLYYMENMSFNLDLAILLKTFFAVLKRIFRAS